MISLDGRRLSACRAAKTPRTRTARLGSPSRHRGLSAAAHANRIGTRIEQIVSPLRLLLRCLARFTSVSIAAPASYGVLARSRRHVSKVNRTQQTQEVVEEKKMTARSDGRFRMSMILLAWAVGSSASRRSFHPHTESLVGCTTSL